MCKSKCYSSGKTDPNFTLVEPKEKYEVASESRRGRFHEEYFRRDDAATRAKEMIDDLTLGLEADAIEAGSITIRKTKNG